MKTKVIQNMQVISGENVNGLGKEGWVFAYIKKVLFERGWLLYLGVALSWEKFLYSSCGE